MATQDLYWFRLSKSQPNRSDIPLSRMSLKYSADPILSSLKAYSRAEVSSCLRRTSNGNIMDSHACNFGDG
uniref:Uncharacterized protein n=1 Tax=Oryza punctata TaxID=4537 RepID=A0A0E0M7A3_ORYPU